MWRLAQAAVGMVVLAGVTLSGVANVRAQSGSDAEVTVGVVVDGPRRSGEAPLVDEIAEETRKLLRDEFTARFPAEKVFTGEWTEGSIAKAFGRALGDPEVDIVLAEGLVASHLAVQRDRLPKPTIAMFVVDPTFQGAPIDRGTSGRENLAYLTLAYGIRQAIRDFRDLVNFEHLALLVPAAFLETAPDFADRLAGEYGDSIRLHPVPVRPVSKGSELSETLTAIPASADAVYVAPLPMLTDEEFSRVLEGVHARNLPTFAHDANDVDRGALAGMAPPPKVPQFARRIALYLQRILLGENPSEFSTSFMHGSPRLVLNMRTARKLDFRPDWMTLSQAKLLHEEETAPQETLTLPETIRRALAANPESIAGRRDVGAVRREIARARRAFFPQAEVSLNGRIIDSDRAEVSFGAQPERQMTVDGRVSQLVFSEPALANIEVQKRLHESRQFDQETLELDVMQAAANAYLNVLTAKTLLRVERDNLERTRSNLSLARSRRSIGVSGPAEVHRWEARIAGDERAVLEARARLGQAEITLNRLLGHPQTRTFSTAETGLQTPDFLGTEGRLERYISNTGDYAAFRDFVASRAIEN